MSLREVSWAMCSCFWTASLYLAMHGPVHFRSGYKLCFSSATSKAHLACDRPYSCSLEWGLGWLGGPPQRVNLHLEWSTLVICLGAWALTVDTMLGAAGPSKGVDLVLALRAYAAVGKSKFIFRTALLPSPKELWEPTGILIGITPSSEHHKLTCKWGIWPCDLSTKILKTYHCIFKLTTLIGGKLPPPFTVTFTKATGRVEHKCQTL